MRTTICLAYATIFESGDCSGIQEEMYLLGTSMQRNFHNYSIGMLVASRGALNFLRVSHPVSASKAKPSVLA